MKNNSIFEIVIALILIAIVVLILNPFNFWMPTMVHTMMLIIVFIVFGLFAAFILREKVQDERESAHRMNAGRLAFLSGSAILVIGIIFQDVKGTVDGWLIAALVVMVLTKIIARLYSDYRL
jgi:hypothetical protein